MKRFFLDVMKRNTENSSKIRILLKNDKKKKTKFSVKEIIERKICIIYKGEYQ